MEDNAEYNDDEALNLCPTKQIFKHLAKRVKNIIIIREEVIGGEGAQQEVETKVFTHLDPAIVEGVEGNTDWATMGMLVQVIHNILRGVQVEDPEQDKFKGFGPLNPGG